MPVTEDNRVVIRVWPSNLKEVATGKVSIKEREVGHVSIETPNCYMSLWPQGVEGKIRQYVSTYPASFHESYVKDIKVETDNSPYASKQDLPTSLSLPSTIVCLYSLDVEAMEARFRDIVSVLKGWTLMGNQFLVNKGNAHSCASLAYTLLQAGGIYKLVSRSSSSHKGLSVSASPAGLATFSQKLKQAELNAFPDTNKFKYEKQIGEIRIEFEVEKNESASPEVCEKTYQPFVDKETPISPEKNGGCKPSLSMTSVAVVGAALGIGLFCYNKPEAVGECLDYVKSYLPK